jgi:hypothetical protein
MVFIVELLAGVSAGAAQAGALIVACRRRMAVRAGDDVIEGALMERIGGLLGIQEVQFRVA